MAASREAITGATPGPREGEVVCNYARLYGRKDSLSGGLRALGREEDWY